MLTHALTCMRMRTVHVYVRSRFYSFNNNFRAKIILERFIIVQSIAVRNLTWCEKYPEYGINDDSCLVWFDKLYIKRNHCKYYNDTSYMDCRVQQHQYCSTSGGPTPCTMSIALVAHKQCMLSHFCSMDGS